jgi:ribonucleoside-triphosphate reductase (thioredoxin)
VAANQVEAYQNYYPRIVQMGRYSRHRGDRREFPHETDQRLWNFVMAEAPEFAAANPELRDALAQGRVYSSQRLKATAGFETNSTHISNYNCAYLAITDPTAFSDIFLNLLNRVGVGFSVEEKVISQLPNVPKTFERSGKIVVDNTPISWAHALGELVNNLYAGKIPEWDTNNLVPAGTRMKEGFLGRAPDPKDLEKLFAYTRDLFLNHYKDKTHGEKLTLSKLEPIEIYDLICNISVAMRGSPFLDAALICLFDKNNKAMMEAKSPENLHRHPYRTASNNSMVVDGPVDEATLWAYWKNVEAGTGEPGIMRRDVDRLRAADFGRTFAPDEFIGANPCLEVVLNSHQFCCLGEAALTPYDTKETIKQNLRLAVRMATFQATLTKKFDGLSPKWKEVTERERLILVSFSGIFDNAIMRGEDPDVFLPEFLRELREIATEENIRTARELNINPSPVVLGIKPSGNVSAQAGCSAGISPAYSKFYMNRLRMSANDPLTQYLINKGFPHEAKLVPDTKFRLGDILRNFRAAAASLVGWQLARAPQRFKEDPKTYIFPFPMRAPEGARTNDEVSAMKHMDLIETYNDYLVTQRISTTITIKPEEMDAVRERVFKDMNDHRGITGLAFYPYHPEDAHQKQLPLQKLTEAEYQRAVLGMPQGIDFSDFVEPRDTTTAAQEAACTGGACSIKGIGNGSPPDDLDGPPEGRPQMFHHKPSIIKRAFV